MWTDEAIQLLKIQMARGASYQEIASALHLRFGIEVTRNKVAGKIKRLRDAGELKRPDPRLGANIKPESEIRTKLPPPPKDDPDRCIGDMYLRCQWPTERGKCHEPIGRRFPGVANYCTNHQVKAISTGARSKVMAFHKLVENA